MKFACIEYNTKSGGIWRPTPERPNYLCDHKREIDAASFGTWTSALNGEHIPLNWFVSGKNSYGTDDETLVFYKAYGKLKELKRKIFKNKIKFKNLDYLKKFDVILVCHHFYYSEAMLDFLLQAREVFKDILFIGGLPYNLGRVREFWRDPVWYENFVTFFNNVDIFAIVDYVAKDYYSLIVKKPIIYFPTFYPVEYAQKCFVNRVDKKKIIFIAGDTKRLDTVWGMHIAKKIQEKFPEYLIQVINTSKINLEPLKGTKFELLSSVNWETYLKTISKSTIVINMDIWWTNGRVPSDCAAVGTPCIGVNANRQIELFPALTCEDISGTKKAIELGYRLLNDNSFYNEIQKIAFSRLEYYSYENSVQQFKKLINLYYQNRLNEWEYPEWLNKKVLR